MINQKKKISTVFVVLICIVFASVLSVNGVMVLNNVPPDDGCGDGSEITASGTFYSMTQYGAYWWLKAQTSIVELAANYEIGRYDQSHVEDILRLINISNAYFSFIIKDMLPIDSDTIGRLKGFYYDNVCFSDVELYNIVSGYLRNGDVKGLRTKHLEMQKEVYNLLTRVKDVVYPDKEIMWEILEKTSRVTIYANYASRLCFEILN